MTMFRYVKHGDSHRHVKDGCSDQVIPMLDREAAFPVCPSCLNRLVLTLRREGARTPEGVSRCSDCGGWVRDLGPCLTCATLAHRP